MHSTLLLQRLLPQHFPVPTRPPQQPSPRGGLTGTGTMRGLGVLGTCARGWTTRWTAEWKPTGTMRMRTTTS